MLILTRKPGEKLYIGDNIVVTIVEIKGHQIRVGIDAPAEYRIYREEIYIQIMEENRQAAAATSDIGLEKLGEWQSSTTTKPNPLLSGKSVKLGANKLATSQLQASKVNNAPEVIVRRKKKNGGEND